jgi:hypothetical protein
VDRMRKKSAEILPFNPTRPNWDGGGNEGNWLLNLPMRTRFIAMNKADSGSEATEFQVLTDPRKLDLTMLARDIGTPLARCTWVITPRFSQQWELLYLLEAANGGDI